MTRKSLIGATPLFMVSFCYAQERPNVVFILVDDMNRSDIGCYGGEIMTPHIDVLSSIRSTFFPASNKKEEGGKR